MTNTDKIERLIFEFCQKHPEIPSWAIEDLVANVLEFSINIAKPREQQLSVQQHQLSAQQDALKHWRSSVDRMYGEQQKLWWALYDARTVLQGEEEHLELVKRIDEALAIELVPPRDFK